jgi:hypothetical protein
MKKKGSGQVTSASKQKGQKDEQASGLWANQASSRPDKCRKLVPYPPK